MNAEHRLPPEALDRWAAAAAAELGLDAAELKIAVVLDMTADIAHGVARPAAPLSSFLVGLALGRGTVPGASLEDLAARLSRLAADWDAGAE